MIRQVETWKTFIVENQTHYNQTNESKFNLVDLTLEERGWTELFQSYPPVLSSGGSSISPINNRSYSWTYGFLPVGYFGVNNQSRVFTTDDTWTCPEGVEEIYVRCIGRGGNGGSGGGKKGGSGGGFIMAKIKVVPGTDYAVAVSSTASFGGLISATAGGSNGGSRGIYNNTTDENIEILFKGYGGTSTHYGGSAGGSELGDGANSTNAGGAGLQGKAGGYGGGGMLTSNTGSSGAGFKSVSATYSNSNGGGMFSDNYGLKSATPPYYTLLSEEIKVNLENWGTPGYYGGGTQYASSNIGGSFFSGGTNYNTTSYSGGSGGFGGGGSYGRNSPDVGLDAYAAQGGVGGNGGYGGGGGMAGDTGDSYKGTGTGTTGARGGNGGGGGGAGGNGSYNGGNLSGSKGGRGGAGGNGGYGCGGGAGGNGSYGYGGTGSNGSGGSGGAALVILEW